MNKIRKIQQLSRAEWTLLGQAIFLLPLTALALRLFGLRRWQRWLTRLDQTLGQRLLTNSEAQLQTTARFVAIAARKGWSRANCLSRSLTLWWLLLRRGIASELRIGVRKNQGQFEAHAWVEVAGIALNESSDVYLRFSPFAPALFAQEAKPR